MGENDKKDPLFENKNQPIPLGWLQSCIYAYFVYNNTIHL